MNLLIIASLLVCYWFVDVCWHLANIGDDLRRGRPAASQKPSCSGTPTDDCKERAARVDGVVTEAANMARQAMISIYLSIYIYQWSAARPWSIYMMIYIYILKRRAAVEHLLTYACINLISQCQPWATSITVYKIYNPPSGIPYDTVQVSSLKTTSGQLRFQFPIKSFTALTIPDVSMEDAEHLYPWAFATRTQTTWCWLF